MGEYIPYTPNYFAIDDILATQEKIPCKVLIDVPKMGKVMFTTLFLEFQ